MVRNFSYETIPGEEIPILGREKKKDYARLIPKRYVLALFSFLGIFNVYTMRVNLSVAMVAMVREPPHVKESEVACLELMDRSGSSNSTISDTPIGEFDWDSSTQGMLLGAFFFGYIVTQIPGGIIAEKYGAKWLFGIGVLVTSIFTILTPFAARWSIGALMAVRIIEGLGEGVTFPAMNALIGRWVPKMERSTISTIIYSGSPLGTVVAMLVTGLLCNSTFFGGWPSVFYLFGTLGCFWFVFWISVVYESPDAHPGITQSELDYIHDGQEHVRNNRGPIPWKYILTSVPLWALIVTHFGYNWGFYTLLTELPTYLSNIQHFQLEKNGILSSLPYLIQALCAFMASFTADRLRASGRLKITIIRKLFNSVAFYGAGIIVLAVTLVGCHSTLLIVLLTISVGLNGFMYSGFNVTHVDMSPDFAGTLMGITNCVANTAGFLAPTYVGWIISHGQTVKSWNLVFLTTALVYFATGTVYNLFCTAELQSWGITKRPTSQKNPNIIKTSNAEIIPRSVVPSNKLIY